MEKAFCRSLADGSPMTVTTMWLYAVMVMMRDAKRTHKARTKTNKPGVRAGEMDQGPRSQKK